MPAIVPGKPDESYLIDTDHAGGRQGRRCRRTSRRFAKPEIELIARWIAQGALDDSPQPGQGPL